MVSFKLLTIISSVRRFDAFNIYVPPSNARDLLHTNYVNTLGNNPKSIHTNRPPMPKTHPYASPVIISKTSLLHEDSKCDTETSNCDHSPALSQQ